MQLPWAVGELELPGWPASGVYQGSWVGTNGVWWNVQLGGEESSVVKPWLLRLNKMLTELSWEALSSFVYCTEHNHRDSMHVS